VPLFLLKRVALQGEQGKYYLRGRGGGRYWKQVGDPYGGKTCLFLG